MVYCCQNHSGSPALTAPVPKKALTPCATVYGFDAPFQAAMQVPPSASLSVSSVTAALHTLKQAEHVQEAAGMAYDIQSICTQYSNDLDDCLDLHSNYVEVCIVRDRILQTLDNQSHSRFASGTCALQLCI